MSEQTRGGAGALRITLVRSTTGRPKDQGVTVRALRLRRLHQTVERPNNPAIRGMVTKIRHLVQVEESAGPAPADAEPAAKTTTRRRRAGTQG